MLEIKKPRPIHILRLLAEASNRGSAHPQLCAAEGVPWRLASQNSASAVPGTVSIWGSCPDPFTGTQDLQGFASQREALGRASLPQLMTRTHGQQQACGKEFFLLKDHRRRTQDSQMWRVKGASLGKTNSYFFLGVTGMVWNLWRGLQNSIY